MLPYSVASVASYAPSISRRDSTRNQLTGLPPEIGNLTALRPLSPETGTVPGLRGLFLSDNELEMLPPENRSEISELVSTMMAHFGL